MGLLTAIYIVNYLDRQVINILAEPIKRELRLADWQIGMMSGLAFAVLYTILGLPLARIAERKDRPLLIAASAAVWSLFSMACGLTRTAGQLMLARVGVGVGEAGCTPAAHSLIVDYAPKEKRASALAFYSMGGPLGVLVGMAFGAVVAERFGWRSVFFVAGAPGLALAVLAAATLPEPRRGAEVAINADAAAPFGDALRFLAGKKTYVLLVLGATAQSTVSYGISPFMASFFLRNRMAGLQQIAAWVGSRLHVELGALEVIGVALGVCVGLAGAVGAVIGGRLADWSRRRNARWYMRGPAMAAAATIGPLVVVLTLSDARAALACLFLYTVLTSLWYGAVFATMHSVVPPRMRATAAAVLFFIMNLIGLGLGPLAMGALSDVLNHAAGLGPARGLQAALLIAPLGQAAAAVVYWRATRTIEADLDLFD
jgi:MFS family permease